MPELSEKRREFYKKIDLPAPEESPNQILRRLMAFRNEWKLYRRRCDFTGEEIISAYHAEVPFPVYKNEVWWGDQWDALAYGREFDFSRSFFDQYAELQKEVPREGTSVFNSENCDYNSHIRESKNCYMNSLIYKCEDTHYSYWAVKNKDVMDCRLVNNSTLCYECMDCENIYDCVGLQECHNCQDCLFSYQLRGCSNCIGCSNLINKNCYIYNKPVSKEEFFRFKQKLINGSYRSLQEGKKISSRVFAEADHRCFHNTKSENVIGDHIINSRNCLMAYDGDNSEDVYYTISFSESNDIFHCYSAGWPRCELIYQSAVSRGSTNIAFCYYTFFSSNLRYCDSSMSCEDCFACIGLKHKKYCILNREYSREEYFSLRERIIEHMKTTGEWGRFFPYGLSTFAYNESAAQDFFPLSEEEVLKKGLRWREVKSDYAHQGENYDIPDSLSDVSDDITKQVLTCEACGKYYRIAKQELIFYRKMNLPLPRFCPESRHEQRSKWRNPYRVSQRKCFASGEKISTTFPPEWPEKVYSKEAYLDTLI